MTKHTLDNGVRIVIDSVGHVQSAAIGLWCRTGSVHEYDDEAGITHLIEHMLFKGTEKRTAKQIAEAIEGRGGALNAFTDKESTCYYCRVLADDIENGVDVLSDMMLHSVLDAEELAREEHVVVEEIKRYEDEPESHVHELHIENRWGTHPLGKPIIGTGHVLHLLAHFAGVPAVGDAREPLQLGLRKAERLADVADGAAGAVGGEARHERRVLAAVAPRDGDDPPLPDIPREVEVHVGDRPPPPV